MKNIYNNILLLILVCNFLFISKSFCGEYENRLIAYYPFNNDVKNVIDSKTDGNHHNVYFVNNRNRVTNSACKFENPEYENSNSYIEIPNYDNVFNLTNATISLWVKYSTISANTGVLIAKGFDNNASGDSFALAIDKNSNELFFLLLNKNSDRIEVRTDLSLNEWHHIVISWGYYDDFSDPCMILYKNANYVDMKSISDFTIRYDESPLLIGADQNFNNNLKHFGFNGMVDDVRIYNKMLINTNIQQPQTSDFVTKLYECNGLYETGFDEGFTLAKSLYKNNFYLNDSDKDGVIDELDECPFTNSGSYVNKSGCSANGIFINQIQANQIVGCMKSIQIILDEIGLEDAIQALKISSGVKNKKGVYNVSRQK